MFPWLEVPVSYAQTRWLSRRGLSRAGFEAAQHKALRRWLDRDLPQVAAYDVAPKQLQDLPILDKARLMADFARYNRSALGAEDVRQALGVGRVGHLTVGASTGTSGNRGYFVITEAERYRWLGAILAKAMAGIAGWTQHVAILLPQETRLYGAARSVPGLALRFFPLAQGMDAWRDGLEAFAPTVLVAPPRVLRQLAEARVRLSPRRIFSAAETLDPVDRPIIEAGFGLPLGQIYMATEGLLAVTCAAGRLHLAEESVFFEFESVGEGLVSPMITSFRRQEQIMARYRMNDLLRLSGRPCPCGAPQRVVEAVVGRMDDCFRIAGQMITPDIPRNAVVAADPRITDFRIVQRRDYGIDLILPPDLPEEAAFAALHGLQTALTRRSAAAVVTLRREPLKPDPSRKLRRVECCLPHGSAR
jgi:putative adenylate-forming enzyme